jgi:ATP-binding cassette subfamily C protein
MTNSRIKQRMAVLSVLFVIGSLLDSFSVVLVFSLFKVIVQPEALEQVAELRRIQDYLAIPDTATFLIMICAALLLLFLFKGTVQLTANWMRLQIEWRMRAYVGMSLLDSYLHNPYVFHLKRGTNELIRNAHHCSSYVTIGALCFLDLLCDVLVVAAIGVSLIWLQPVVALTAFVSLAILGMAYLTVGRRYFRRWGTEANDAATNVYRALVESLTGIKQIKSLGAESFFVGRFALNLDMFGAANLKNAFAQQALKPVLEVLFITALLVPVIYLLANGIEVNRLIPALVMFGAAFYRIMPSVVRLATTIQTLRFGQSSIAIVHADLEASRAGHTSIRSPSQRRIFEHEIRLKNVTFKYGGAAFNALEDINLSITRGQSVGFVGGSGAGKTTIADIFLGLLDPTEGAVYIDGHEIPKGSGPRPSLFGYVPQDGFLIDDTAANNVALGSVADEIDLIGVEKAIVAAALDDVLRDRPDGLNTLVGDRGVRLSGGQRQRLAIARALYHDPEVLILDEATSALDSVTEAGIADTIQRLRGKKTLIVIAHRLSTVRHCDVLFFLDRGRLVDSGSFDILYARNPSFRRMVDVMKLGDVERSTVHAAQV